MPEINKSMFQRIHSQITTAPESHVQAFFEMEDTSCGTTRCVAGWALWFDGIDRGSDVDALGVGGLAERYLRDVKGEDIPDINSEGYEGSGDYIVKAATDILGLDLAVADRLFYTMSNPLAVLYVAELATGSVPVELTSED